MTILQKYKDIETCVTAKKIINIKLSSTLSNLSNVISFFSNIDNDKNLLKRKRLVEEDELLPSPLPLY
jgi:hypothetical protein